MAGLLLGVDIGTASAKGVLAQPDGTVVARASRPHTVAMPRAGWAEHDAETVWWNEFVGICRELLAQATGPILAVGISGIGPCVVPCDANDRPLRPAILYGIDARATHEIEQMTDRLGTDAILRTCGSVLSAQALGPKLLWLRNREPEIWAATVRWHMASSFIVARLTGEWILDHHSASQCDPFYDLHASTWNHEWVSALLPDLPLPRLAWSTEVVGHVTEGGSDATGLATGTPVIAGTIDCWAEAASVGVRQAGELMVQYGSTVFLVLGCGDPGLHPGLWTTRGVDPGSLTIAAGLATGGSLVEWFRQILGGHSLAKLLDEADRVESSEGLVVLPYFAGERTPILDPRARGTLIGLTLRHGRGHLFRAILEGIALGIRHNLDSMAVSRISRAIAVGGGAKADLWLQIVSDVTGLSQIIPAETVGASYGGALLAAEAVGAVAPGTSWVRAERIVSPDVSRAAAYDELFTLYRELYLATRHVQHRLAAIQLATEADGHSPLDALPEVESVRAGTRTLAPDLPT